jgi:hypothetical protein
MFLLFLGGMLVVGLVNAILWMVVFLLTTYVGIILLVLGVLWLIAEGINAALRPPEGGDDDA